MSPGQGITNQPHVPHTLRKSIKIGYVEVWVVGEKIESWQVISVKNDTSYRPGIALKQSDVDRLCASPRWDVTLVQLNSQGI